MAGETSSHLKIRISHDRAITSPVVGSQGKCRRNMALAHDERNEVFRLGSLLESIDKTGRVFVCAEHELKASS